jgi:hypothetical protein
LYEGSRKLKEKNNFLDQSSEANENI